MIKLVRGILEAAGNITPEIKSRFKDEGLCKRCGRCCYAGIRIKGRMILLPGLPCKYLGFHPGGKAFCTVYQIRDVTGWCNKVSAGSVRKELFPPDCPYVEGIPDYRGKIVLSDSEFEQIKPILCNIFKGFQRPDYLRPGDWSRFIHHTLGLPMYCSIKTICFPGRAHRVHS